VNLITSTPVDIDYSTEGNRLIARDVFPGGERSCIKQQLGEYKTPEHAEVMAMIYSDPRLMIAAAAGRLTQEIIDNAVILLRERKHANHGDNPGGSQNGQQSSDA